MTFDESGNFPRWFVRLIIGAALGWFMTLLLQTVGGVWWAAQISAKIDFIQAEIARDATSTSSKITDLEDNDKLIALQITRLSTDYAVLKERVQRGD